MSFSMNRRSLVKLGLLAPLALALPQISFAAGAPPANALPETDPMANALKYKADASKADAMRTNKTATCKNCAKFNKCSAADSACKPAAKAGDYAPCELFMGKQVAATGWCMSWEKKA